MTQPDACRLVCWWGRSHVTWGKSHVTWGRSRLMPWNERWWCLHDTWKCDNAYRSLLLTTAKTFFHMCITSRDLCHLSIHGYSNYNIPLSHSIIKVLMSTYFSLETSPASLRRSSMALTSCKRWPTETTPISFRCPSSSATRLCPHRIACSLKHSWEWGECESTSQGGGNWSSYYYHVMQLLPHPLRYSYKWVDLGSHATCQLGFCVRRGFEIYTPTFIYPFMDGGQVCIFGASYSGPSLIRITLIRNNANTKFKKWLLKSSCTCVHQLDSWKLFCSCVSRMQSKKRAHDTLSVAWKFHWALVPC